MIKCLFLHKSHKTPHCHLRQRGVLFWLGNRIHQIYFVTRLIIFSSGLLHTSWFATFHRIRVLHRKPPNRFGQPSFDFSIGVQLWDRSFHQGCTHWFRHSKVRFHYIGDFTACQWVGMRFSVMLWVYDSPLVDSYKFLLQSDGAGFAFSKASISLKEIPP